METLSFIITIVIIIIIQMPRAELNALDSDPEFKIFSQGVIKKTQWVLSLVTRLVVLQIVSSFVSGSFQLIKSYLHID